jgi:tRNA/tmRNA/rRNA uracil-C5-methylase (TrmA/RlmC/RlmD family)
MAAKLQVRLTFEGGEEMKKALAQLGVTGNKTFKGIGSAGEALSATIGAIGTAVKKLVEGVAIAGGAIAAVGAAIFEVAKSSAEAADQAGKAAEKIGINAQAYQELAFAAQLANVQQDSLQEGLKNLNKNLSEARPAMSSSPRRSMRSAFRSSASSRRPRCRNSRCSPAS